MLTILDACYLQNGPGGVPLVDWARVKASGKVAGVYFKANESTGGAGASIYVDSEYVISWAELRRVGLRRGAYSFVHVNALLEDAVAEALRFAAILRANGFRPGVDMPPTVDIEEASRVSKGVAFVRWVRLYVETLESACGAYAVIYTGGPFWDEHDGDISEDDAAFFRARHLWLAAYVLTPDRYMPQVWRGKPRFLWQDSGNFDARGKPGYFVDGIGNVVDHDVFDGTEAELDALIAASAIPGWIAPTDPAPPPSFDLSTLSGVQSALAFLGFSPGPIDGKDGPRTQQAVRAFQVSAPGLRVDGDAGPKTKDALRQAVADRRSTVITQPGTPRSKSSASMRAVDAPIVDGGKKP